MIHNKRFEIDSTQSHNSYVFAWFITHNSLTAKDSRIKQLTNLTYNSYLSAGTLNWFVFHSLVSWMHSITWKLLGNLQILNDSQWFQIQFKIRFSTIFRVFWMIQLALIIRITQMIQVIRNVWVTQVAWMMQVPRVKQVSRMIWVFQMIQVT